MPVSDPPRGALSGIVVLDLGRVLAAPWAAQILGDLGADVIKIERPRTGDEARLYTSALTNSDGTRSLESATFLAANRNKRSIEVDLAATAGQEIVRRLAVQADVVIENFLPDRLARYGLGYDALAALNPGLIYCSITGYGQDGPHSQRPGYDAVFQAHSGMMEITGEPDDQPGGQPMKTGPSLVDVATGYNAVIGILAALHHRDKESGRGQHIDIALMDTAITMQSHIVQAYLVNGEQPPRLGTTGNGGHPAKTYRTDDGFIYISANQQRFYEALCGVIGVAELIEDPRFATGLDRYTNRCEWDEIAAPIIRQWRTADLTAALVAVRVPCSPVNQYTQTFADPQVAHRGVLMEMAHPVPTSGKVALLRNPLRMSVTPTVIARRPPLLGEHTDEILASVGYDATAIAALRANGAV